MCVYVVWKVHEEKSASSLLHIFHNIIILLTQHIPIVWFRNYKKKNNATSQAAVVLMSDVIKTISKITKFFFYDSLSLSPNDQQLHLSPSAFMARNVAQTVATT